MTLDKETSYRGTVKDGVVVLEPGVDLPDGTAVRVEPRGFHAADMPRLLRAGKPSLRDHRLDRCRRRGGRGDIKRYPGVPAGGPVFASEFPIGLEVEISLQLVAERYDEAELRADAHDL